MTTGKFAMDLAKNTALVVAERVEYIEKHAKDLEEHQVAIVHDLITKMIEVNE